MVMAGLASPASVTVRWHDVMAVAIPQTPACQFPDSKFASAAGGTSATDQVVASLAYAVTKAAEHAAIQRALVNIDGELLQTRRRLRLLERRRLPQLEQALAASQERLDQGEREDILRLRWARAR